MKNITTVIIWSIVCLSMGCGETTSESSSENAMESFPRATFEKLLSQCDYVDIIFYDSPVSMSQDEARSIRSALLFIDPQAAIPAENCKPLGRITYMIKGDIIAEADFYCSENCNYMIFMENNAPRYANTLSESGLDFFSNILKRIEQEAGGQ